jgi:hypothetical protein
MWPFHARHYHATGKVVKVPADVTSVACSNTQRQDAFLCPSSLYSKTSILQFCGNHLKTAKNPGKCKIWNTFFLWAIGWDCKKVHKIVGLQNVGTQNHGFTILSCKIPHWPTHYTNLHIRWPLLHNLQFSKKYLHRMCLTSALLRQSPPFLQ